ncbi:hypothetical protein AAG570_002586 [Ranatra chinensis]|uniref:Uncharacterized protein n=1 Tax=Ranatra chinensis TaxID=642074 RepID=A0ABD0YQQ9_9HEMI
MASKRRNIFYENQKQDTTEIADYEISLSAAGSFDLRNLPRKVEDQVPECKVAILYNSGSFNTAYRDEALLRSIIRPRDFFGSDWSQNGRSSRSRLKKASKRRNTFCEYRKQETTEIHNPFYFSLSDDDKADNSSLLRSANSLPRCNKKQKLKPLVFSANNEAVRYYNVRGKKEDVPAEVEEATCLPAAPVVPRKPSFSSVVDSTTSRRQSMAHALRLLQHSSARPNSQGHQLEDDHKLRIPLSVVTYLLLSPPHVSALGRHFER